MRASLSFLLLLAAASVARADAIGPPTDCPPGTRDVVGHAGSRCAAWTCENGACDDGLACAARRVCTVRASVHPGGWSPPSTPPAEEDQVVATCLPDESCSGTEPTSVAVVGTALGPPSCALTNVCVEPPPAPPPPAEEPAPAPTAPSSGGGSCAASRDDTALGPIVTLLALLAIRLRR